MVNLIFTMFIAQLGGIIAGIILGVVSYKKLPKRFLTAILHIGVAFMILIVCANISIINDAAFRFIFFATIISIVIEIYLLVVNKIVNKIKNKKTLRVASIAMIFLLIVIFVYIVINIASISSHEGRPQDNNVKNWFRCKILFGNWIVNTDCLGMRYYECSF